MMVSISHVQCHSLFVSLRLLLLLLLLLRKLLAETRLTRGLHCFLRVPDSGAHLCLWQFRRPEVRPLARGHDRARIIAVIDCDPESGILTRP